MRALSLTITITITLTLGASVVACSHDFDALFQPSGDGGGDGGGGACAQSDAVPYDGRCFFPVTDSLTWDGARSACESMSAHLASIDGAGAEAAAEQVLSGQERWIGLHLAMGSASTSDAQFAWEDGTPRGGYKHWYMNQPNGDGACVRLRANDLWDDEDCGMTHGAICETP